LDALPVVVILTAERVTLDKRFRLLDDAGVVQGAALSAGVIGIIEFDCTARTVRRALENAPGILDQGGDFFIGTYLGLDANYLDPGNGFASFTSGSVAFTSAQ
jgi:hypothetical protein